MTSKWADDDALLMEALAFIGDLDFDADVTLDEEALTSRLLREGTPGIQSSPPPIVIDPTVSANTALARTPVPNINSSHITEQSEVQVTVQSFAAPQKWPGAPESKAATHNRSRARRRDEITYLRGLVGALEKQLKSLHPSSRDMARVSPTGEPNKLVEGWAQVAIRQYDRLHESEMENMKLKWLLQDQIQLGKSLERILIKLQPTTESPETNFLLTKRLRHTKFGSPPSGFVFDELVVRCTRQYAETATVLYKFTDDMPVANYRDIKLVYDPDRGLAVQTMERGILPFDYEDTATEIWGFHLSEAPANTTRNFDDVDQTEDTLKLRVRVSADVNGARAEFSVSIVMRRYVESRRTVIVVSGIAEPTEIADVQMEGVRMRASAWIVLEPLEANEATKLTAVEFSVPEADDGLLDESRKVGTLTNFLLSSKAAELDYRSQQWENRLIQQAADKRALGLNGVATSKC